MPLLKRPRWGRAEGTEGHACKQGHLGPPRSVTCVALCVLGCGSTQLALAMMSLTPIPLCPGMGVKTWAPWVSSVSSACHPWSLCGALHVADAPWRASHFPARAQAHMPAVRVPPLTPSPDGLFQASSTASITPRQFLGQGHAGTQLARVFPSMGAAGSLAAPGVGVGLVPSMET